MDHPSPFAAITHDVPRPLYTVVTEECTPGVGTGSAGRNVGQRSGVPGRASREQGRSFRGVVGQYLTGLELTNLSRFEKPWNRYNIFNG